MASIENMKNFTLGQAIGVIADSSKAYTEEDLPSTSLSESKLVVSSKERNWPRFNWMRKFRITSGLDVSKGNGHEGFIQNSSDSGKRNLSLGKIILQAHSSVERSFRKSFSLDQDEILSKCQNCYLYTTAGPIKGILFTTTKKIAFCSDKPLLFTTPKGESVKVPYKVLIPISRLKEATPSKNINKPEENYLYIVTKDNFEFWFSGFSQQKRSLEFYNKLDLSSDNFLQFLVIKFIEVVLNYKSC